MELFHDAELSKKSYQALDFSHQNFYDYEVQTRERRQLDQITLELRSPVFGPNRSFFHGLSLGIESGIAVE